MLEVITFLPMNKSVKVQSGTTILQAARRAGIRIPTRCDGKAACLMCKVNVGQDEMHALLPPSEPEKRKLGHLIEAGTRLSCQAKVRGELKVHIPEDPLKTAIRKQLERQQQDEDDWFS